MSLGIGETVERADLKTLSIEQLKEVYLIIKKDKLSVK